ncbi:AarF/UbiB family protein, partial [Tessaracoccus sp. OH4464_COT-324]|uniref:AarF/UbiB family protein n=1 Tax=Tessaracoccus sp. OH4464_COT-324 TaxID=2491059 RepID=UPI000FB22E1A
FGLRLRLALQELGPVWIKLGQMLSTRRDLFPAEIADELALLQDQVEAFSGSIARQQIEQAFGCALENWFVDFDETALASASIAQVHTAKLKLAEGQEREVVIKVLRPDIQPQIDADLSWMYKLAGFLPKLSREGYRLRAVEVIQEYEKTLRDELDLRIEMANAIKLR